jgi:hypothetical protein
LQVIQLLPRSGLPPVFFQSWIVRLESLLGQASGETAMVKVRQLVVTLKLSPIMCCRLDHLSYFYVLVQICTCAMNQICKHSEEFPDKELSCSTFFYLNINKYNQICYFIFFVGESNWKKSVY